MLTVTIHHGGDPLTEEQLKEYARLVQEATGVEVVIEQTKEGGLILQPGTASPQQ